ncbi:cyclic nucleotide-binding domain-containing protein [Gammaproteobacteria bacterium]|nr:cyclic nucleotide-binding domain-containing protein [Gammaproteobacteria bacterium]
MPESIPLQAFIFGLISAASLPLGAIVARFWSPGNRVIAALMAFGSGALLAALTIDLVVEALERDHYYQLASGCLIGGILFVILNKWINSQGGFLRKVGTTVSYFTHAKSKDFKRLFKRLSQSPLFNALPPQQIQHLVPLIERENFQPGENLMLQGLEGDSLYIIDAGQVKVVDDINHHQITNLGPDDVVGEISLLTGNSHTATVTAIGEVSAWVLKKDDFDELVQETPEFAKAIMGLTEHRLKELGTENSLNKQQAEEWYELAKHRVDDAITPPTASDIEEAAVSFSAAPLAIWLGIFLDGIPESFVIGSSMLHASISISLIAGLFLSNFPEAFSSSLGMREQGYSFNRILTMWTSLMIFTGIGAWLGSIFFVGVALTTFSLVEGIAAGAMLTVIAETMLPEAYHRGGGVTGISTLLGFLAAIFFTTL